jgi:hypothetical protein
MKGRPGSEGGLEGLLRARMERVDGMELLAARAMLKAMEEAKESYVRVFSEMLKGLPRDLDLRFEVSGAPIDRRLGALLETARRVYTDRLTEVSGVLIEVVEQAFDAGADLAESVISL